ncbi:MAG: 50S ribosomal protein L21 [Candidatus Omnitrophica bacterium]|nr:50S ribosomal protein L21 [Candidatus Omnitrophota bacterium]
MYAVIELGGKQQLVSVGDKILVEKQEIEDGKSLLVENVLLTVDEDKISVGAPYVKGASVEAKVLKQTKGPKLVAFKYRRRKSSHTKKGHRQKLTELEITKIKAG